MNSASLRLIICDGNDPITRCNQPRWVHEAYIRLIDQSRVNWQNRAHFFGVAAQIMRRLLVDHARKHNAEKRGQDFQKLSG